MFLVKDLRFCAVREELVNNNGKYKRRRTRRAQGSIHNALDPPYENGTEAVSAMQHEREKTSRNKRDAFPGVGRGSSLQIPVNSARGPLGFGSAGRRRHC